MNRSMKNSSAISYYSRAKQPTSHFSLCYSYKDRNYDISHFE